MGTGVLSLSASRSVETMWSHYADSHRGFVIGLDVSHPYFSREYGQILAPVSYKKSMPTFRYLEDMDARQVLFTKHMSWAYEREWRLVTIGAMKRFSSGKFTKTKSGYDA
jgi:hypothetical protein